ncbi:MAG: extracellular solute-binding protein [Anaerolineae bacterium]|nr:extracellular solute-binding protein [Anaerolineae bacterium]
MNKFRLSVLLVLCLALMGIGTMVHAQEEVTLTAWTHDQLYIDYFEARMPEFQALHPEITIKFEPTVDSAAPSNALNAIAANPGNPELPDMIGLERGQIPNYLRNGIIAQYFVDLTDLFGDDIANYAPGRLAIYSFEGKVYAIESQLAGSLLYYQPSVFEAAGVEVPTTWEQVLNDVGPKLVENGSAFTFATNDGTWFQMYFNQRGGQIFDENANFVMGDETNRPLAIEVATFIQQAIQAGIFKVILGGDVWSGATIPTAYTDGSLAGTVMPDWWATCCLEPGVPDMAGKWMVALPPKWEGGGHATLTWGGTGWAIASGSPNAELAKEFLAFAYLGLESQVKKFELINNFPWYIPAFEDERVIGLEDPFFSNQHLGEFYGQVAADVPAWYQSPFGAAANTALGDNLPGLFDGTMTPEQFVDKVVETTQEAIDFGF